MVIEQHGRHDEEGGDIMAKNGMAAPNTHTTSHDAPPTRRSGAARLIRLIGALALFMTGPAVMLVLDYTQYLHWEMPVFAAHASSSENGIPIERAHGPGYEVTSLHTAHDRYMDISPLWDSNTDCTDRPVPILQATRKAVFHRHSAEVTGYDDGIEGVWIADCVPSGDDMVIVYASAVERHEGKVYSDSVSEERVTLTRRDDGYHLTAYDDATDIGRNFYLSPENGGYPFPQYISDMWSNMDSLIDDSQENH